MDAPIRALRLPELIAKVGLRKSSIYAKCNPQSEGFDADFPRPARIGGITIWVEGEVDNWLRRQIERRDASAPTRVEKARRAAAASVAARAARRAAAATPTAPAKAAPRRARKAAP